MIARSIRNGRQKYTQIWLNSILSWLDEHARPGSGNHCFYSALSISEEYCFPRGQFPDALSVLPGKRYRQYHPVSPLDLHFAPSPISRTFSA